MVRKSININLEYDNAYFEEETMWFVERNNNILCQVDIDKKSVAYHGIIPYGNKGSAYRRHPQCVKYKNYIVCFPDRGKSFVVYNIEKGEFRECAIDTKMCERIGIYNFWEINGNLWCMSSGMNCIIEFDPILCKVVGYYSIFNGSKNEVGVDACAVGTTIICTSIISRTLAFFDVNNKMFQYYNVESNESGYNSVSICGTKIYLTGYSRYIYVFDTVTQEICSMELSRDDFHVLDENNVEISGFSKHPIFRKSFMTEKFIVFLPWYMPDSIADSIVIIFVKTGKIRYYNILQDIYKNKVASKYQYLYYMRIINSREIEIYLDREPLVYLNVEDESISYVTAKVKDTIYGNIFSDKSLLFSEVGKNDLREYIHAVTKFNRDTRSVLPDSKSQGMWRKI